MGGGGGDRLRSWRGGSCLSTGECEYEEGSPVLAGGWGGARLGDGRLKGSSLGVLGASSGESREEYEGCLTGVWGEEGGVGGGSSTGGGGRGGVSWSWSSVGRE